jgi:hypothetical protein
MVNIVFHLRSQFSRSIGFDSSNLYISSLQFAEIESLRNECLTANKRSSPKIPFHTIQKIVFDDQDEGITIHFLKESGKKKNIFIDGFDPELKALFGHALAKIAGITNYDFGKNKTKDFEKHYISIGGTILGTSYIAWVAESPRTGRRSNMGQLAQNLGAVGVSIIGGLFIIGILYLMYKQSRRPANQHVYKRQ